MHMPRCLGTRGGKAQVAQDQGHSLAFAPCLALRAWSVMRSIRLCTTACATNTHLSNALTVVVLHHEATRHNHRLSFYHHLMGRKGIRIPSGVAITPIAATGAICI